MLCSGDELGLTSDADGILILPADTPIGMPVAEVLGDVVLDVDVKPNRGDALSIVGLAREVAAAVGGKVRWPEISVAGERRRHQRPRQRGGAGRRALPALRGALPGRRDRRAVAPRRAAAAHGRRRAAHLQRRGCQQLRDARARQAHPHVRRRGRGRRQGHRPHRAVPGEKLETLDHVVRELDAETLVIADASGPIGIAGVMGGAASEVNDGTTAVIVESAIFDPVSVRRTAFKYGLRSEASLRFEKGQEHRLARIGADRAAQLIAEWAGARAATGVVDTDPVDPPPARLPFRPSRVSRLLGVDVPADEQRALLARVEVATEPATADDPIPVLPDDAPLRVDAAAAREVLVAIVPTHRRDLQIEADIAGGGRPGPRLRDAARHAAGHARTRPTGRTRGATRTGCATCSPAAACRRWSRSR